MTPPFDNEFGPGVRTVRHTPAPDPWLRAPTHNGLWWVWNGETVELTLMKTSVAWHGVCWSQQRVLLGETPWGTDLPVGWRYRPVLLDLTPPEAP